MVDSSVFIYYPDKYKTYPIKFSIRNNDTINRIDKYGLKQGYWYEEKENKGYLKGYYVDDMLRTVDSKEYYPGGKLKFILQQADFKNFESEEYFENGNPRLHIINHDTSGIVSTRFYQDGKIERLFVTTPDYDEEKLFYPNGHIMKITGNNIHQDYYPTGVLKKEFWFINDDSISYKYYYEDGHLMATHYVKKGETSDIETWKFYDENGKSIDKKVLTDHGYNFED